MYVRVVGTMKSFSGKKHIGATHIVPVEDHHEIYFHILEAMAVTATLERGAVSRLPPITWKRTTHLYKPGIGGQVSKSKDVVMGDSMSAYAAPSSASALDSQYRHLPPLQQAIVRFMLEQPHSAEGIHVYAIARAVGDGTDAEKIKFAASPNLSEPKKLINCYSAALDSLMDEGLVYTTTDDSHFTLAS